MQWKNIKQHGMSLMDAFASAELFFIDSDGGCYKQREWDDVSESDEKHYLELATKQAWDKLWKNQLYTKHWKKNLEENQLIKKWSSENIERGRPMNENQKQAITDAVRELNKASELIRGAAMILIKYDDQSLGDFLLEIRDDLNKQAEQIAGDIWSKQKYW